MPLTGVLDVNNEFAVPAITVPLVGFIVPFVALQSESGIFGSGPPEGIAGAEFVVISAVIVELPAGRIAGDDAATVSTIQGVKFPGAATVSQPVLPGPALQPHQLFWALSAPRPEGP